ncbi:MAG: response regulator [Bryobacteraceae bacterium]
MLASVLIVDDSPLMRAFIQRVLAAAGIAAGAVVQASDGEEALAVLRHRRVDLILTDINMPRMDGEEFLRAVEADESLRGTPVVVVSTDSSGSRVNRMLALGAQGYLGKPFQPETLRAEVQRILHPAPSGGACHG